MLLGIGRKKNNIITSDTSNYTGKLIPDPLDVNLYSILLNIPENTGDDTITVKYTIYQEGNESKYTNFYIKQMSDNYMGWYIKQTAMRIDFNDNGGDLGCLIELVGVNWYLVDSNGNYLDVSLLLDHTAPSLGMLKKNHMYCDVSVLFYAGQDSSTGSYVTYDSSIELKQNGYDSSKGKWEYTSPVKQEGSPYLIFLNNFKTKGPGYYVVIIKGNENPIFTGFPLLTASAYKGYKYKGLTELLLEAKKTEFIYFYFYENVPKSDYVTDTDTYIVCCNGTPVYNVSKPPIATTITPSSVSSHYNVYSTTGEPPGTDISKLTYISGTKLTDISKCVTANGVYDVGNAKALKYTTQTITCYITDKNEKKYIAHLDLNLLAVYRKEI